MTSLPSHTSTGIVVTNSIPNVNLSVVMKRELYEREGYEELMCKKCNGIYIRRISTEESKFWINMENHFGKCTKAHCSFCRSKI